MASALALASPAFSSTTYTIVAKSSFARRVAGPDLLVGTGDDVTPPALPGADGQLGTADDLFANPAGSTGYLRFAQLPLGGDYEVFATGTLIVQAFTRSGSLREATDFALSSVTAQTNGLGGTLTDSKIAPHFLRLEDDGALSGAVTLRSCIAGGGSCVDVSTVLGGAGMTNAPGLDDPARLPGLTAAQRAYLAQLKAQAPVGWSQIWLLLLPPTTLSAANVSGPSAPFLIGGKASLVLALVTSDPSFLPIDSDGDGIANPRDNCPFAANASQADRGGVGSGSGADGIGDACQCGDVSGDGRVTLTDAVLITRSLLAPPTATLLRPDLCDVAGAPSPATQGCTLSDAVVLRRALLSPPSAVLTAQCRPANP